MTDSRSIIQFTAKETIHCHFAHTPAVKLAQDWRLVTGQHWLLLKGSDGQRRAVLDELQLRAQQSPESIIGVAEVSARSQEAMIQSEQLKAKVGLSDELVEATQVKDFLANIGSAKPISATPHQGPGKEPSLKPNQNAIITLLDDFDLSQLANKGLRQLSTGETRRLLLIAGLIQHAELLLLENPLEGIDRNSRPALSAMMEKYFTARKSPHTAVLTTLEANNRIPKTLPHYISHVAIIENDQLFCFEYNEWKKHYVNRLTASKIKQGENSTELPQSSIPIENSQGLGAAAETLIKMKGVVVRYQGLKPDDPPQILLNNLDWEVIAGQHWQVTGANGTGKTTILKLITGDHPQSYRNDIEVLGYRRGSGESIWDIKKSIGFMSAEMLWQHRGAPAITGSVLNVVISGLHDSVGLYRPPANRDKILARQWLQLFDLLNLQNTRFTSLSLADQRLCLIARAMIKQPKLLLLDEPCQGLDEAQRARVQRMVKALLDDKQTTLIYVSHYDEERIGVVQFELNLDR